MSALAEAEANVLVGEMTGASGAAEWAGTVRTGEA